MILFIQNTVYLLSILLLIFFGGAFYYCRTHGIENGVTLAGYVLGFAALPVSFFYKTK